MPFLTEKVTSQTTYGRSQTTAQENSRSSTSETGARTKNVTNDVGRRTRTQETTRSSTGGGTDTATQAQTEDYGLKMKFRVPIKSREPVDPDGSADLGCP